MAETNNEPNHDINSDYEITTLKELQLGEYFIYHKSDGLPGEPLMQKVDIYDVYGIEGPGCIIADPSRSYKVFLDLPDAKVFPCHDNGKPKLKSNKSRYLVRLTLHVDMIANNVSEAMLKAKNQIGDSAANCIVDSKIYTESEYWVW